MDNRIFSNNEAARITGTTPRQVLSWTERGMIIPVRETSGTGVKRGYNYINLLEIYLCNVLIRRHFNFQKIKEIFSWMRNSKQISDWATNFENWHFEAVKKQIDHFNRLLDEAKKTNSSEVNVLEPILEMVSKMNPAPPDEPTGVLIIFYDGYNETFALLPYNVADAMKYLTNKKDADSIQNLVIIDVINLGKVKSIIDKKLI